VFEGLRASNKKKLITEIAAHAAAVANLNVNTVFETLWEREKLSSTGVGHGIAIPHARLGKLERIVGVFAHLDGAVDFESIDEAPVDLVFALLTPVDAGADHLKALARVARLLRNPDTANKLRDSRDADALYAVLAMTPSAAA
jgi:nitrogen PTS system EIIA component